MYILIDIHLNFKTFKRYETFEIKKDDNIICRLKINESDDNYHLKYYSEKKEIEIIYLEGIYEKIIPIWNDFQPHTHIKFNNNKIHYAVFESDYCFSKKIVYNIYIGNHNL